MREELLKQGEVGAHPWGGGLWARRLCWLFEYAELDEGVRIRLFLSLLESLDLIRSWFSKEPLKPEVDGMAGTGDPPHKSDPGGDEWVAVLTVMPAAAMAPTELAGETRFRRVRHWTHLPELGQLR